MFGPAEWTTSASELRHHPVPERSKGSACHASRSPSDPPPVAQAGISLAPRTTRPSRGTDLGVGREPFPDPVLMEQIDDPPEKRFDVVVDDDSRRSRGDPRTVERGPGGG